MTELRRSIKCSNCGVESTFSLGSDFVLNELVIHAKCSNCGSSLQINFNIVEQENSSTESTTTEEQTEEKVINLEDELFQPDMLTGNENDIKDIIDES